MLTNRISQIVIVTVIAAVALLTVSMVVAPHPATSASLAHIYDQIEKVRASRFAAALSQQAFMDQRAGEWTAGFSAGQAYLDQRKGEQTAGVNSAIAYLEYRRGEWSGK